VAEGKATFVGVDVALTGGNVISTSVGAITGVGDGCNNGGFVDVILVAWQAERANANSVSK